MRHMSELARKENVKRKKNSTQDRKGEKNRLKTPRITTGKNTHNESSQIQGTEDGRVISSIPFHSLSFPSAS